MTASEWIYTALFVYFPYIAGAIFIAGVVTRCIKANGTVQALSSQYLSNDAKLRLGSPLFHFAIVGVFFGHIFGLLAPEPLYIWLISNETKRILAIIMGGAAGLVAFVGIAMLLIRRFSNERVVANSTTGDKVIVALIFLQIATGLLGTLATSQGTVEDYLAIDHWAQRLVIMEPRVWQWLVDATIVHKIHILLGFCIVAIFPFTKLMHMIAMPVKYLFQPNRVVNRGSM